ncbi:hypothetical protein [Cohaesibacter sp. CAU 1516]|uniref:hypothetical protein n=1 Tax=Cohaesibacter sp. CAU 1516 TaxID=2576038 RepID=UPI0014850E09|nr:hypothetical protein [Cohaesibacter sp. CAU 1516]
MRRFDEEIAKSDLDGRVNMKLGLLNRDQAVRVHQARDNDWHHLRNAHTLRRCPMAHANDINARFKAMASQYVLNPNFAILRQVGKRVTRDTHPSIHSRLIKINEGHFRFSD